MDVAVVVVKVGSSSLSNPSGGLDRDKLQHIVDELAGLHREGVSLLLVSSGAVAAGFNKLGFRRRPRSIAARQAAAAVGQGILIEEYTHRLQQHGITAAQILLNRSDFSDRTRYVNAFNTLTLLLRKRILPIINENDTVSVDELTFGDNDRLSALVAGMVKADLLILLSDVDGLYDANPHQVREAKLISDVPHITPEIERMAGDAGSPFGTGGMRSKVEAAKIATASGVPVFLGRADRPGIVRDAYHGRARGTYFSASGEPLPNRKQWLRFMTQEAGRLGVDDGAAEALLCQGKSLLASGIRTVSGQFAAGDVVLITHRGEPIGKGITRYSSQQLEQLKGKRSEEIEAQLNMPAEPVIHRDQLVLLVGKESVHRS